jgi:hypothetical protein
VIDEKTLGPFEPVFTFVGFDGKNVSIHSGRLREEVLKIQPEVVLIPVNKKIAKSYIDNNCVNLTRVLELLEREDLDPVIFCENGFTDGKPDVMLVDGHHRYVMCALLDTPHIPAVILYQDFWRRFQIVGLQPVTADLLRKVTPYKRNY